MSANALRDTLERSLQADPGVRSVQRIALEWDEAGAVVVELEDTTDAPALLVRFTNGDIYAVDIVRL